MRNLVVILAALPLLAVVAPQAHAGDGTAGDAIGGAVDAVIGGLGSFCQNWLFCDKPKPAKAQSKQAQPPAKAPPQKAAPAQQAAKLTLASAKPQMAQAVPAVAHTPKPVMHRAAAPSWAGDGVASWVYYNRDPAYPSKAAAIADSPNVMRRAGWSQEVISAVMAKMREAPERIEIRKGDRYDFMRTGPSGLWRNVRADFASPGRGAAVVVNADSWTVVVDGVTYEWVIPDSCYNLAGRKRGQVTQNSCVYTDFESRGEQGAHIFTEDGSDPCFAVRQVAQSGQRDDGTGWNNLGTYCSGRMVCSPPAGLSFRVDRVGGLRLFTHGHYQVRHSANNSVAVCLEYNDESSFTVEVRRQDFRRLRGESHARIYHRSNELPRGVAMNDPGGLFFWPSSPEEAAHIHAGFAR